MDIETVDNAESNASIEGSEKKIPAGIMLKLDPIQRIHFCIEETNRKLPQQKIDTDELSDSVAVSCLPPAQGVASVLIHKRDRRDADALLLAV